MAFGWLINFRASDWLKEAQSKEFERDPIYDEFDWLLGIRLFIPLYVESDHGSYYKNLYQMH